MTKHYACIETVIQNVEPTCFVEAIGNVHWKRAMDEKIIASCGNKTWNMVLLLDSKKTIRCKWL